MVQFISTIDEMKRLLCVLLVVVFSVSCYAQGTFRYSTMRNEIWGEWKSSENPFDRYLIHEINTNEWVIYRYCNHPANYLFRLKLDNFRYDNDKQSRKEHVKNKKWYEFTGNVEFFTDSETFVSNFPFVPTHDKPEIKSQTFRARIMVEPYKKRPKTLNIFFDNVGIALLFGS